MDAHFQTTHDVGGSAQLQRVPQTIRGLRQK